MLEEIDIKRRDGIAHVALNRPALRNAVTLAMWRELAETFSRFAAEPGSWQGCVLPGPWIGDRSHALQTEFCRVRDH